MEVNANRIFLHQCNNDSAETIKLEMSPVGGSVSTGSGSVGSVEDEITKSISDLNIFDLLHNNPPSSSDDNEEAGGAALLEEQFQRPLQQPQQRLGLGLQPVYGAHQGVVVAGGYLGGWTAMATGCNGGGGGPRHRTPLQKLKSSLKLSSQAQSSCSSASFSSNKSVRFAPQLTTVKRFDLNSEPISISNENSPELTSLDQLLQAESSVMDKFWFGTPSFGKVKYSAGGGSSKVPLKKKNIPRFTLDYDSDDSDEKEDSEEDDYYYEDDEEDDNDDDDDCYYDEDEYSSSEEEGEVDDDVYGLGYDNEERAQHQNVVGTPAHRDRFTIKHWELASSNLTTFHHAAGSPLPLQDQLLQFLQGHNIKLNKVSLVDQHTIKGSLYVANLNFEKFIEVKFSFDEWKNIHYVTAQYLKTVTSDIDEFQFIIDLSSYKYFMKVKNLLYCHQLSKATWCPVTMALCCRYDVNGETYYDNNNYENYQFNARCLTAPAISALPDVSSQKRPKRRVSRGGRLLTTASTAAPRAAVVSSLISGTTTTGCRAASAGAATEAALGPVVSRGIATGDSTEGAGGAHSKFYKNVPLRKSSSYDFLMNFTEKKSSTDDRIQLPPSSFTSLAAAASVANSPCSSSPSSSSSSSSIIPPERPSIGRRFSEYTDYFNTSPLKHMYHFDSSTKMANSAESSPHGGSMTTGNMRPASVPLSSVSTSPVTSGTTFASSPTTNKITSAATSVAASREYIHESRPSTSDDSLLHIPRVGSHLYSSSCSATPTSVDTDTNSDCQRDSDNAVKNRKKLNPLIINHSCNSKPSGHRSQPAADVDDYEKMLQGYPYYPTALPPDKNTEVRDMNAYITKPACSSPASVTKGSEIVTVLPEDDNCIA